MTNEQKVETTDLDPEMVPIWQESYEARWMVHLPSAHVEGDDYSGWTDVDADARRRVVGFYGEEYTSDEARTIAQALVSAADHAENFAQRAASTLIELTHLGRWPEIDGLPVETQRVIRDALRAASDRYRRNGVPRVPAGGVE